MNKKRCVQCGARLPSHRWKYCSRECSTIFQKRKYAIANPFSGITSATTGAISELRVAVLLLSKGFDVFRALSPSASCDLAVLKNGILIKIEVRTVHKSSSGQMYRSYSKRDDPNIIDAYAWVLPDEIIFEPSLQEILSSRPDSEI